MNKKKSKSGKKLHKAELKPVKPLAVDSYLQITGQTGGATAGAGHAPANAITDPNLLKNIVP